MLYMLVLCVFRHSLLLAMGFTKRQDMFPVILALCFVLKLLTSFCSARFGVGLRLQFSVSLNHVNGYEKC